MDDDRSVQAVRGPVVAICDGDVIFFRSATVAEAWMEAIDVENGEYEAVYDERGRRLRLEVISARRKALFGLLPIVVEVVRIRPDPSGPIDRDELRATLTEYFDRTGLRGRLSPDASVRDLIHMGVAELGV